MIRKIVHIDEEKCTGCGLCADACHEGAIAMVDGKAHLVRDDYCDGLGDCLPACPADAISIIEREAADYDENAVAIHLETRERNEETPDLASAPSELRNWPVQIKLAPTHAPYFNGADLLIAADCTAFSYASFHHDFIRNRTVLVGCPKLDGVDYTEKLAEIIRGNDVASITVCRMEVPCCGGLEYFARQALEASGKRIPLQVITISIGGDIL